LIGPSFAVPFQRYVDPHDEFSGTRSLNSENADPVIVVNNDRMGVGKPVPDAGPDPPPVFIPLDNRDQTDPRLQFQRMLANAHRMTDEELLKAMLDDRVDYIADEAKPVDASGSLKAESPPSLKAESPPKQTLKEMLDEFHAIQSAFHAKKPLNLYMK